MNDAAPTETGRTKKREPVLLIGRRKGAIDAAKRCGWKPVVIDAHARGEQAPGAYGGSRALAVEEAIEMFSNSPPIGVVAVATGSVMAAAAIRERFGLPGLSVEAARRCHDKLVMKKAITAAGLPCAPWRETDESTTPEELIRDLGLPIILKMAISSGGRGVWICETLEALAEHLRPGLLAEGFVHGTEMSVETFRHNGSTVFRNHTRYLKPCWANVIPAGLNEDDAAEVNELAERVHEALGIHTGMSHMEVFLTVNGPVFGEIAARPPGGYLMELIGRAYDFDPWEALLRISLGEEFRLPEKARCFAGVWILHPGEGTVSEVIRIDEVRKHSGVVDVSCTLQPGDKVSHRIGSGQSKGRIVVESSTAEECAGNLTKAAASIRFTMI